MQTFQKLNCRMGCIQCGATFIPPSSQSKDALNIGFASARPVVEGSSSFNAISNSLDELDNIPTEHCIFYFEECCDKGDSVGGCCDLI